MITYRDMRHIVVFNSNISEAVLFYQLQIQQRGALRVSLGEELHPRRYEQDDCLYRFQVPVERDLGSRPSIIAHLQT